MKPELLLSVDSKQSFWIDPRTKLYMLVIFSIVMIDGKTDGISFWLKPILALIPFFLLLSGRRKKIAIIYLIVFIVSWTVNVFLVPYMGFNRNNYNIAVGSIWDKMVSKRHDGLLSSLDYKG